jgi:hypothetical protein
MYLFDNPTFREFGSFTLRTFHLQTSYLPRTTPQALRPRHRRWTTPSKASPSFHSLKFSPSDEIALSRICRRVHRLSQSTGLFDHLVQFNTRCEIGVVLWNKLSLRLTRHMRLLRGLTNSIICSTTEVLKTRTREERSIEVPE